MIRISIWTKPEVIRRKHIFQPSDFGLYSCSRSFWVEHMCWQHDNNNCSNHQTSGQKLTSKSLFISNIEYMAKLMRLNCWFYTIVGLCLSPSAATWGSITILWAYGFYASRKAISFLSHQGHRNSQSLIWHSFFSKTATLQSQNHTASTWWRHQMETFSVLLTQKN